MTDKDFEVSLGVESIAKEVTAILENMVATDSEGRFIFTGEPWKIIAKALTDANESSQKQLNKTKTYLDISERDYRSHRDVTKLRIAELEARNAKLTEALKLYIGTAGLPESIDPKKSLSEFLYHYGSAARAALGEVGEK